MSLFEKLIMLNRIINHVKQNFVYLFYNYIILNYAPFVKSDNNTYLFLKQYYLKFLICACSNFQAVYFLYSKYLLCYRPTLFENWFDIVLCPNVMMKNVMFYLTIYIFLVL